MIAVTGVWLSTATRCTEGTSKEGGRIAIYLHREMNRMWRADSKNCSWASWMPMGGSQRQQWEPSNRLLLQITHSSRAGWWGLLLPPPGGVTITSTHPAGEFDQLRHLLKKSKTGRHPTTTGEIGHALEDKIHFRCIGVSPGGLQLLCLWSEDGCHAPSDGCPFGTVACKRLSERMDDILRYLHCCLEEKRLEQFLIGSEAVPAEIILCQDFWVSKPLNLFQCLVQELANYFWVQRELDELPDQLTRLLISRQWQTSTCPRTSFSWRGYCRDAWDLYSDVALLPFPFTYWAYSQLTPAQVCISSEDQRWGKIISQIQKYFQNLWDKDRNHSSKL